MNLHAAAEEQSNKPFELIYNAFRGVWTADDFAHNITQALLTMDELAMKHTHFALAHFARLVLTDCDKHIPKLRKLLSVILQSSCLKLRSMACAHETMLEQLDPVFDSTRFHEAVYYTDSFTIQCIDYFEPDRFDAPGNHDGVDSNFLLFCAGFRYSWLDMGSNMRYYSQKFGLDASQWYSMWLTRATNKSEISHITNRCKNSNIETDVVKGQALVDRMLLRHLASRMQEICAALHELDLPVLLLCAILDSSYRKLALQAPMHLKWKLAAAVKHFHQRRDAARALCVSQ